MRHYGNDHSKWGNKGRKVQAEVQQQTAGAERQAEVRRQTVVVTERARNAEAWQQTAAAARADSINDTEAENNVAQWQ